MAAQPTDVESVLRTIDVNPDVEVRSESARELDIRIMPWDLSVHTLQGTETFARGAFDGTDPAKVMLMGLEHEAHLGLGQDGRPVLTRRPVGRGISIEDREDGAHMTFRVSKTSAGDEVLALAMDGIVTGASIEFSEIPGGTSIETRGGRRLKVHKRVALQGLSTTYRPAYQGAGVLAVRSIDEGDPVTESAAAEATVTPPPAPAPATTIDFSPITEAMSIQTRNMEQFAQRILAIEERSRRDIQIPANGNAHDQARAHRGEWVQTVLRMLSGERVSDLELRALDDLITTDNVGVVPDAFVNEIIGVIDPRRPFLGSTRRLDLPPAGMSLVVPKIVTRPETGVQASEKAEVASNTTSITTATFDAVTIAGAGDISLQLLKRSSPSFLSLYLELLAESYSTNAEIEALQALLAAGVTAGGALEVEDAAFGDAWIAGSAVGKPVDTIWLSSEAVGAFIDAKADGTNMPLYSSIQAGFTAGSGPAGTISGLRPVHVPALDSASATIDVIVGPSSGFGWTEDGTYTLQVDVPAKAGRDVAIAGILWFAPMYPSAFTTYTIAS